MEGSELDVAKRAIAATKLMDDDELICSGNAGRVRADRPSDSPGIFLAFPHRRDPDEKEKRPWVLGESRWRMTDFIEKVHYLAAGDDAIALYKEKEVHLNRLRIGKRDTKGVKTRVITSDFSTFVIRFFLLTGCYNASDNICNWSVSGRFVHSLFTVKGVFHMTGQERWRR